MAVAMTKPPPNATSSRRDYIGVPDEQPPRVAITLPDIREATPYRLACFEPIRGRVSDRDDRFEAHRRREITVDANEFDLSLEGRKVDDSGPHEVIEDGAFANNYLVVGRVDHQLIGPHTFESRHITLQRGDAKLVIERAHYGFVGTTVLRGCQRRGDGARDNDESY
jgi:hypothetical protein